jgi:hypothetical protein
MKVTVNNQDKEEVIDWNKVQLVIGIESGKIYLVENNQQKTEPHLFRGISLSDGYYSEGLLKKHVKPFHGSITLQND